MLIARYRLRDFLLLITVVITLEVKSVQLAALKLNECELNNYSPCRCSHNEQGVLIFCEEIHPAQVQNVFKQSKSDADLHFFYLSPSKLATSYQITSDILSGRRTDYIQIECQSSNKVPIQIDGDAFRSTSTKTTHFDIRDCDLSRVDFNFLRGFNRLKTFTIESGDNVQQSIRTLPRLPALEQLDISMSNGLAGSSFRNLDEVALQTLKLEDNDDLNDGQVQNILQSLAVSSISSMRSLQLAGNQLTAVPSEVAQFKRLNSINLGNNKITRLVNGQFKFEVPVSRLHLDHNLISSIEPEAFQGNFGSARVFMAENSLTRFEESVFKAMLRQMSNGIGRIYIDTNPFQCDCHLAWLIRDNRELLRIVEGGTCSNGTTFSQLNSSGFDDCQEFTTSSGISESSTGTTEISSVTPSITLEDKVTEPVSTLETLPVIDNATTETTTETINTTNILINNGSTSIISDVTSVDNQTTATPFIALSDTMNVTKVDSTISTSFSHATASSVINVETPEMKKVDSTTASIQLEKTTMAALDTTTPSTQITRDSTEKTQPTTTLIDTQQTSASRGESSIHLPELTSSTSDVPVSQVLTSTTTTNDKNTPSTASIESTTASSSTTLVIDTILPPIATSTKMPITTDLGSRNVTEMSTAILPSILTSTEVTSTSTMQSTTLTLATNDTTSPSLFAISTQVSSTTELDTAGYVTTPNVTHTPSVITPSVITHTPGTSELNGTAFPSNSAQIINSVELSTITLTSTAGSLELTTSDPITTNSTSTHVSLVTTETPETLQPNGTTFPSNLTQITSSSEPIATTFPFLSTSSEIPNTLEPTTGYPMTANGTALPPISITATVMASTFPPGVDSSNNASTLKAEELTPFSPTPASAEPSTVSNAPTTETTASISTAVATMSESETLTSIEPTTATDGVESRESDTKLSSYTPEATTLVSISTTTLTSVFETTTPSPVDTTAKSANASTATERIDIITASSSTEATTSSLLANETAQTTVYPLATTSSFKSSATSDSNSTTTTPSAAGSENVTASTDKPAKKPANSNIVSISTNVTFNAPSDTAAGHAIPIADASGGIAKPVSSFSSRATVNQLVLALVAVVKMAC